MQNSPDQTGICTFGTILPESLCASETMITGREDQKRSAIDRESIRRELKIWLLGSYRFDSRSTHLQMERFGALHGLGINPAEAIRDGDLQA